MKENAPRASTPSSILRSAFGWAACAALAWACGGNTPPPAAPEPEPEPEASEPSAWPEPEAAPDQVVFAEFQTSAQAMPPGGTFLLAVRFDIAPGYRISWTNPGDIGRSTRVAFEVPDGFEVGPVQFPAPSRFESSGGLISYGYENQTAVFAEVRVPKRVSTSRAYRFDVKADWLACKSECATEELSAWFELVASYSAPKPRLPSELRAHHRALPGAFSDLPESNHDWKGSKSRPQLRLSASDVKWLDFFPGSEQPPTLLAVKARGEALEVRFDRPPSEQALRGLAVAEVEGERTFFDVNVPWP